MMSRIKSPFKQHVSPLVGFAVLFQSPARAADCAINYLLFAFTCIRYTQFFQTLLSVCAFLMQFEFCNLYVFFHFPSFYSGRFFLQTCSLFQCEPPPEAFLRAGGEAALKGSQMRVLRSCDSALIALFPACEREPQAESQHVCCYFLH